MSTPQNSSRTLWANVDPALLGRWAGTRARRMETHGRVMSALTAFCVDDGPDDEGHGTPPTPVGAVARVSIPTPIRRENRERVHTPLQELYAGPEAPRAQHRERAHAHEFTFGASTAVQKP